MWVGGEANLQWSKMAEMEARRGKVSTAHPSLSLPLSLWLLPLLGLLLIPGFPLNSVIHFASQCHKIDWVTMSDFESSVAMSFSWQSLAVEVHERWTSTFPVVWLLPSISIAGPNALSNGIKNWRQPLIYGWHYKLKGSSRSLHQRQYLLSPPDVLLSWNVVQMLTLPNWGKWLVNYSMLV